MNQANVEKFYHEFIQNNPKLQEQLGATESKENFIETAVQLGKENGYIFTAEEVDSFMNQKSHGVNAELSDLELEAVAGGKWYDPFTPPDNPNFTFCLTVTGCILDTSC
jgi:predicted ribosomally synthesized peptide with nif11-like leader